ncbi:MAG TPA: VOC family protein [Oligoflexia bacterium]|nr:VOC family protein [Oligoflexia bacterium]HMP49466.1 VOC family protein [Oligoflexia bacterium]
MKTDLISPDEIRSRFSLAMSKMYREEVPAYGTLIDLVLEINNKVLSQNPELKRKLEETDNLSRISEERHGAIRLGTRSELKIIRRIFAVMGMKPVSYYDLTSANVPVHSTAFRSIDSKSLSISPFRVFTSLLRTELISDNFLRKKSEEILNTRNIFTKRLIELLNIAENEGGLKENLASEFISEATFTFKWHRDAATDKGFYESLKKADPRAADIVCFKGPHINHLTPRTLDIDSVHNQMPSRGMSPKNVIEGPPPGCPVLLRQTSFKALTEPVFFNGEEGFHTARFGEIEQRGAALTPKGRELYDYLLEEVRSIIIPSADGSNAREYMEVLSSVFKKFPSSPEDLRKNRLAYFNYFKTAKFSKHDISGKPLDTCINEGLVDFLPITYEDFLPISAAGIFSSNASDKTREDNFLKSSKDDFEEALGEKVLCEFELYREMEDHSLNELGIRQTEPLN